MSHTVFCVKLKRELPGLEEPPFDNDLGSQGLRQREPEAVMGYVDRTLQDAAQRIPPEPRSPRRSGSHRQAVRPILLWRRLGRTQGIRPSSAEIRSDAQNSAISTAGTNQAKLYQFGPSARSGHAAPYSGPMVGQAIGCAPPKGTRPPGASARPREIASLIIR